MLDDSHTHIAGSGPQVGWGAQLRVLSDACDEAAEEGINCELIDLRSDHTVSPP